MSIYSGEVIPTPSARAHTPPMPGTRHSPEDRARLETIAIAMRKAGADMQAIAEATGVSVTTLHKWARESGWRLEDLGAAAPASPAPADSDPGPHDPGTPDPGIPCPGAPDPDTPVSVVAAAHQALTLAAQLAASGNLVQAEKAARLSERFLRLKEAEIRPGAGGDAPESETYADSRDTPSYQLGQRLGGMMDALYSGHLDGLPAWAQAALHRGDPFRETIAQMLSDPEAFSATIKPLLAAAGDLQLSILTGRQVQQVGAAHETALAADTSARRAGTGGRRGAAD